MKKGGIATAVLTVCAILAFTSGRWAAGLGFFGEVLRHGFIAATIGGLADWFAVTAIFKKPFGFVTWQSDILRRNRQRIMGALTDFSASDLLNEKNISESLQGRDFSEILKGFWARKSDRARILSAADLVLVKAVQAVDTKKISEAVSSDIVSAIRSIPVAGVAKSAASAIADSDAPRRMAAVISDAVREIINDDGIQFFIREYIAAIKRLYAGNSSARESMFQLAGLTDDRLAQMLNEKVNNFASSIEHGENTERTAAIIRRIIGSLGDDPSIIEKIEMIRDDAIKNADIGGWIEGLLDELREKNLPVLREKCESEITRRAEEFFENPAARKDFNRRTEKFIAEMLKKESGSVRGMIETRLSSFSDDELVEMAESRVADDLQMIRINGSVVGALAGMALYLFTAGIGRLFG